MLLLLLAVAACGQEVQPKSGASGPSTSSGGSSGLPDGFDSPPTLLLAPSQGEAVARQLGTAAVRISEATTQDGRITIGPGPDGNLSFRFPRFTTSSTYPRAVLRVTPRNADDLDPGTEPFAWGADFDIDRLSSANTGVDNGDNLVQRGLSSEPAIYKAELDHDRPACTVEGTEGKVIVRSDRLIQPGIWYRMRCIRDGDKLTLTLRSLAAGTGTSVDLNGYSKSATGKIGSVRMLHPGVPVSIGGKLAVDGGIINSATDQFNGWIAEPMIEIGDTKG